MLQNYFKVAIRNLQRNRLYTFINIFGLTIGMCCFILIALYIQNELGYDTNHEKYDQIFRIAQHEKGNTFQGIDLFAKTPQPLASAIRGDIPEIIAATTLQVADVRFSHEKKVFQERGLYSDEYIFDVFTFHLIEGIGASALKDPNAIILTHSMAKKYFRDESPIGKTLLFQGDRLLTVRGVIEDAPRNQHFRFQYLTSFKNFGGYSDDQGLSAWATNSFYTYVVLPLASDYKEVEDKLSIIDRYLALAYESFSYKPVLFLQPLRDIHLHSELNFEIQPNSDIRYIYLSFSIALIILLLACINYMNLALVRSTRRAQEVGMRKVLGANRRQLVHQFLGESFLVTFFSFILAMVFVSLLLPSFNKLLDQSIQFSFRTTTGISIGMFLMALLLGGFSGIYPAFVLSIISPVKALKGGFLKNHQRGATLRKILVVGQFTAAIVLAIGSIVIYQQLQYIQNKKLGYNRDQVVYFNFRGGDFIEKRPIIRSELLKHPQIDKITFTTYMPLNMTSQISVDSWEGNPTGEELRIYRNYIDYDFIELFEIELLEGRNFSPAFSTDSTSSYILNESALKALGWESAIGKTFNDGQVVGVVKDFHFQPFSLTVEPLFMKIRNGWSANFGHVALKLGMENLDHTIAHLEQTMTSFAQELPFEHKFLDESYNQLYQSERRFGLAFSIFTLLALFIACMGLFGLVAQHVLQRTKEIGIRKVLGASVSNILGMISKDFLKLVFIATIIAFPIAWWGMNQWLQDFAYRINIGWSIFAIAGGVSIGIAFLTVSSQASQVALASPIDSLRSE